MIRKLPESSYSVVFFYSLLVAGLFVFTAWKAIEEDGPDFGGNKGIGLTVQYVIPDCDYSPKPVELWCSTTDLVRPFSEKNKEITKPKQPPEPGSLIVDFSSDFGPRITHPFQKFKSSFSPLRLWSPNKTQTIDWDFLPKIPKQILPVPSGMDILNRNTSGLPSARLFSNRRSNASGFESGAWSTGYGSLTMTNGFSCEEAIRVYCSQSTSGTNASLDTSAFLIDDCVVGGFSRYRGARWYRFSGTGDQINIHAISTGTTADIQVFRTTTAEECDSLMCFGGAYDIHQGEKTITVNTIAGLEYFIMLANFADLSPTNNMSYTLTIECVCGSRHLEYDPPNDFTGTGTFHIRTDSTLEASNQIFNGNSVTYNAAQGIHLNNGFEVKSGAIFEARVEGCPTNDSPELILLNGSDWRSVGDIRLPELMGIRQSGTYHRQVPMTEVKKNRHSLPIDP